MLLTFVKWDNGVDDFSHRQMSLFFLRILTFSDQPVIQKKDQTRNDFDSATNPDVPFEVKSNNFVSAKLETNISLLNYYYEILESWR